MIVNYNWKPANAPEAEVREQTEIEPITSDLFRIIHSDKEFVFDFALNEILQKRIICNPEQAKQIRNLLANEIAEFETVHGKIKISTPKRRSFISELKQNLYRGHKVTPKLTIINPTRKKNK